jgi:hypothetical protein
MVERRKLRAIGIVKDGVSVPDVEVVAGHVHLLGR